ncbi:MAG: SpoIIE family protein phosphatase [Colwellia sp.]|nr:SpoIIE family protein phosphatase [Colwellia sp.]
MHIKTQAKLALVVDDSMTQCMMLSALLKEEGYQVVVANDGACGVDKYVEHQPDLVLMDINMPVMDGYEATRRIKKVSRENLAPLIFITSMDTDQAYIDSVEAGGDGILVRPFSPQVFKAKIKSIQRISDLYQQVKNLQQEQQKDAELAKIMMSDVIESRNFALNKVGVIKQAATMFSGDMQLTALCPNGDLHVLLGDFTGHGLRASIGAIPVTETFRAMTKKGFSILDIVAQINKQLCDLLPKDLFFAACFIAISEHDKSAYIFNAGLPDGYLFSEDAEIKHHFPSVHPPLGILPKLISDAKLTVVSVGSSDRFVLITDGIIEARNEQGHEYGVAQFEYAAKKGVLINDIANNVVASLEIFCQNMPQEDDISLVDVPCSAWQEDNSADQTNQPHIPETFIVEDIFYDASPSWSWRLELTDNLLASVNPVPIIMNQINEIEGAGEHWQSLYTIITELFINALDHGVLGMDSSLKDSAEGFSYYFKERTKRLEQLKSGFIRIELCYFPFEYGGKMFISIKDSGLGFDIFNVLKSNSCAQSEGINLSGRGVELVNQLCDTLDYQDNGSLVSASYVWHNTKQYRVSKGIH